MAARDHPTWPVGRVRSRASCGIDAPEVLVETFLRGGIGGMTLVGLPEVAVREAKQRVESAIRNSNLPFPSGHVIVNLAPADLPKEGGRFDLPIAVSILAQGDGVPSSALRDLEIVGELGLNGDVRPVRGTLSATLAATAAGRGMLVPTDNAIEATLAPGARVYPIRHLIDVIAILRDPGRAAITVADRAIARGRQSSLDHVRGQHAAKRAIVIAAAGGHHLLMQGPPGAGKTLLARCLRDLLPPLTESEAIDVVRIHSAAGLHDAASLPSERPFREPHHTASAAAVIGGGGGRLPAPGEISLAHQGVLFLDEFPEFDRRVIEALREPLESGQVTIARVRGRMTYPAGFQLVAALNPCPAGRTCTALDCTCGHVARERYLNRLSAPILDRIDLRIEMGAVNHVELFAPPDDHAAELTASNTVVAARARQWQRAGCLNARLPLSALARDCVLSADTQRLLETAVDRGKLTARGCHRTIRVARTIADLAGRPRIAAADIAEALSYRNNADRTERDFNSPRS